MLRVRERLADQFRSHGLAAGFDQAAVCLSRKRDLGDPGDEQRVGDACDDAQDKQKYRSGSKLLKHDQLLNSVC